MGDKSIKKETKKKKKSDIKPSSSTAAIQSVVAQPQLIDRKKKTFDRD